MAASSLASIAALYFANIDIFVILYIVLGDHLPLE